MSEYTIVNLKEVEDQAPNFGLSPQFEARFARVALEAELVGLTYQKLAPNLRVPWGHTHKTQEEVFLVLDGSLPRQGRRRDPRARSPGTRSASTRTRCAGSRPGPRASS